jgi:hypothetical protein
MRYAVRRLLILPLNQTWVNIDAWIQEQGDMAEVTQQRKPPIPGSQRPAGE